MGKMNQNAGNESRRHYEQAQNSSTKNDHKKIFTKDDGEYVDYEEVKE